MTLASRDEQRNVRMYNDDIDCIKEIQKKLSKKKPYLRGMAFSNFMRFLAEEYIPKEEMFD